jgi:lipoprotein signal peptidase
MATTRSRRLVASAAALAVAAIVLVHEALNPTPFHHARSVGALALMAVLVALVLGFVPRVPSSSAALGAGLAAGGALAMFVSGLVWQEGVPDPLVGGGYAFNLADIAIALGDAMLLAAVLVHTWANRHSLRQTI